MTRIIRFPGVMDVPDTHPKFLIPGIADDFNRPDGPLAGTLTTLGNKTWTAPTTVKIAGGLVSMADVAANQVATVPAAGSDYEVQATLTAVGSTPATSAGGLLVRSAKGFVWLSTRISGSASGYQFWQNSNGANLAIGTSYPVTAKAGDVVKIRAKGSKLTAWVNGVLACTAVTDLVTGVDVGFMTHTQGTAARWDNFSVAAL